jgi:hypothetical protein
MTTNTISPFKVGNVPVRWLVYSLPLAGRCNRRDWRPRNFCLPPTIPSQRPRGTITPLALKLNLDINVDFGKDQLGELVKAAEATGAMVLIAWQHEDIPAIGNAIMGDTTTVPQKWPGARFDVVWIFDLDPLSQKYEFSQAPQCLLAGDLNSVIERTASAQG